ncbi:hypothetical protein NDU88_008018 [Pleurodeles waltl]|uniref:Uncharacterized protein n=1 Tax=Pleurodeles waltl TaxID=8319 RepID=A0AAV7P2G1_PLEWA|nr:hypothetical protein NDU88_008018 [Pleurodeles waltl]
MAVSEVAPGTGPTDPDPPTQSEPTLTDIMMAIQGVKDTYESEVNTVTMEVNLMRADLKKVTEKLTVGESQILGLQSVTKHLEDQVKKLTKQTTVLTARLEDQEGRARRNNIRILRVPKGAEGYSVDLFVEDLITNKLQPKRL